MAGSGVRCNLRQDCRIFKNRCTSVVDERLHRDAGVGPTDIMKIMEMDSAQGY